MKKRWIIAISISILSFSLLIHEMYVISLTPVTSFTTDHRADCGVVLTGGPARIREGLDLFSRGDVKYLIISGVHPDVNLKMIFPQWPFHSQRFESHIILEKRSTTTYGNAQQTLALVDALKCRNIVLVTSQVHMYRSLRTFRAAFPIEFPIFERATVSTMGGQIPFWELLWEALKSLFYWPWAY